MIKKCLSFCRNHAAILLIVVMTFAHLLILAFKIPVFQQLPGWYWPFFNKSYGNGWLLILFSIILCLTIAVLLKAKDTYIVWILSLIVLGVSMQYGFAFLEGRGMDGLRDRLIYTGHAEFAQVAVDQNEIMFVLKNYETLVTSGKLGFFAHTKPPGSLFFFMVTRKIADMVSGNKTHGLVAYRNLITTACYLWPFLSFIVLIPLFYYTRMLFTENTALFSCALYLFVPSVMLMPLHTDQVIFPLLAILPILLASLATRVNSMILAILAGVQMYLSLWFSFSLLLILPIIAISGYIFARQNQSRYIRCLIKAGIFFICGLFVTDICFRLLFQYDILVRYEHAMTFHLSCKHWTGSYQEIVYFGFLNLIEFAAWVGMPLIILLILSFRVSIITALTQKSVTPESLLAMTLVVIFLAVAFLGRTKAETARLWLFLVPYICICAAQYVLKNRSNRHPLVVSLIVFLQFLTVYLIKVNQDFW